MSNGYTGTCLDRRPIPHLRGSHVFLLCSDGLSGSLALGTCTYTSPQGGRILRYTECIPFRRYEYNMGSLTNTQGLSKARRIIQLCQLEAKDT